MWLRLTRHYLVLILFVAPGIFSMGWSTLFVRPELAHVTFCYAKILFMSPLFRLFTRLVGRPSDCRHVRTISSLILCSAFLFRCTNFIINYCFCLIFFNLPFLSLLPLPARKPWLRAWKKATRWPWSPVGCRKQPSTATKKSACSSNHAKDSSSTYT